MPIREGVSTLHYFVAIILGPFYLNDETFLSLFNHICENIKLIVVVSLLRYLTYLFYFMLKTHRHSP